MRPYILLTPGPLTTSESVKATMMTDWCTWDEDYNLHIVEENLLSNWQPKRQMNTPPYCFKEAELIV